MRKNFKLTGLALLLLVTLILTYSNHFNNGFHFDDAHTIESNAYIRDLSNLPLFFTDATTFSSLPANRAYRPLVTTFNAIDYRLAGNELDPFYFHLNIFLFYVLQCVLMFFFFRHIFEKLMPHRWNSYTALLITGWYALHTANAETVNYIISRSDTFSTFCIIASFVLYQHKKTRKWHLYLLTMLMGIYTKQTGVMFAPLLFIYILFFEERIFISKLFSPENKMALLRTLKKSLPALALASAVFILNQLFLTPETTVSENSSASRLDYFMTQLFIVTHYLGNFVLPINLSADPDHAIISSYTDLRILFGILVISCLTGTAVYCLKNAATRPIAFGIFWFFIALLPTSSFIPLFQISNDHRTFFPYIGLVMSTGWAIQLLLVKYENQIKGNSTLKYVFPFYLLVFFSLHAYGTHQRNKVWGSAEALWLDVTKKSPANGRGLMNYGLTQMGKGNYDTALEYYMKAMAYVPRYSYLHVNLGILKNAMGKPEEAEKHFKDAIGFDSNNPETFYHYANWLHKMGRANEAVVQLEKTLRVSPMHAGAKRLLEKVKVKSLPVDEQLTAMRLKTEKDPSAESWLDLSLHYYRNGKYRECIDACEKAIELRSGYADAFNNICSAYNQLKQWEKAAKACKQAIAIKADFQLAKNNLRWAEQEMEKSSRGK